MVRPFWQKRRQRKQPPAVKPAYRTEFTPRILSFGKVHCAVDYDLANLSMIAVDGGYVAIDAGSNRQIAGKIASAWRDRAGGPPLALIYTHSHPDHIGGAAEFVEGDAGLDVWGHESFLSELEETQLLPSAYFRRGAMLFGYGLPRSQVQSNGIGPPLRISSAPSAPLCPPGRLVDQFAEFRAGGVRFELHAAPGETRDHLFIWIPEERVLLAGDNIYQAFPNLYSLRGVSPRPVRGWIDSLDAMRRLKPRPELLILGHTLPVEGAHRIADLLTAYRDGIAWVHDSVVRGLNQGKSPDRLAREIALPTHLADHAYLQEHYGTIAASVRGIADGYLGWFDGRAAAVEPPCDNEIAVWLSRELGDQQQSTERIEAAIANGEWQKALWLSRLLLARWPRSARCRELQATILEALAASSSNPLVRNWQRSDAAILRGEMRLPNKPAINGATIERLPLEALLRLLPSRLNPRAAHAVRTAIGFESLDTGQSFTLIIRQGVGELAPGLVESPSLTVRATERNLKRLFLAGDVPPSKRQFWQSIEFTLPEEDLLTPVRRLFRLARISRLFIRP